MLIMPMPHACPHCGRTNMIDATVSGNTYASDLWTDGKIHGGMAPDFDPPWCCAWCDRSFRQTAAVRLSSLPAEPEDARTASPATAEDLESELEHAAELPPGEEKYLRIRLWWMDNDLLRERESIGCSIGACVLALAGLAFAVRYGSWVWIVIAAVISLGLLASALGDSRDAWQSRAFRRALGGSDGPHAARLQALLPLLDPEEEGERLLRAEALRALGRFEEVDAMLAAPVSEDATRWRDTILAAAREGDRTVRVVPRPPIEPDRGRKS